MARPRTLLLSLVCGLGCGDRVSSILPDGGAGAVTTEQRWSRVALPEAVAGRNLFAVSGVASDLVFMVGEAGTVLKWNGTELTLEPAVTDQDLKAVALASSTRGFAVGNAGTILRYDGATWSVDSSGTASHLLGVWADDARALAVGEGGVGVLDEGAGWAVVMNDSPDHLHGVTRAGDQVVAVGTLGTVSRLRGRGMTARLERSAVRDFLKTLQAAATGPSGTFAVGVDGAIFEWQNGFRRRRVEGMPASVLRGVASTDNGLFAVGNDATVVRVIGPDLLVYPEIPEKWVYGVWASSASDVWIVGATGLLLHGPPTVDPPSAQ